MWPAGTGSQIHRQPWGIKNVDLDFCFPIWSPLSTWNPLFWIHNTEVYNLSFKVSNNLIQFNFPYREKLRMGRAYLRLNKEKIWNCSHLLFPSLITDIFSQEVFPLVECRSPVKHDCSLYLYCNTNPVLCI